jgi:hypothetical protein
MQCHVQRNTKLFSRNLHCDTSVKVCLPDNSKYSTHYFTFWCYVINCRYNDTGHFSWSILFFNLILFLVIMCLFIWTIFFYVYFLVCLSISFIYYCFSPFMDEGTKTRHFKHNSKQFLLWLFWSGKDLEFYFGFFFFSNGEILNLLKKITSNL